MKLFKNILILVLAGSMVACDMTEFDLQADPNAVTPENASVNDLYNNIVLNFEQVYSSSYYQPGAMARMFYQGGSFVYLNSISPTTLNGLWFNAYADLFPDIDAMLALTEERGLDIHSGSAKIMKAYALMVLVDLLGDVPLTESGQGTDLISPSADPGEQVYAAAIDLLDEAIAQLDGTNAAAPTNDLFYGGDADSWIKAANTLKLRAALNTRLISPGESASTINSLVSGGNIITDAADDFQFRFGSERNNPNSRHDFYNSHYETGDGAYLSNYFMWLLVGDKEDSNGNDVTDPRLRFYFYQKIEDAAGQDATTYSCHFSILPDQSEKPDHWDDVDPELPYCIVPGTGYSGRDHLNSEGIPPDGPIRTSYGLYPGGGQFDWDQYEDTRQRGTSGGLGQGIWPIMLSSFTDFMLAEAALTIGTNGDPRALLESGIRKSIDKVFSFTSLVPQTMSMEVEDRGEFFTVEERFVPDQDDIDAYVDNVLRIYDEAGSDAERLAVVIKEYYIAAWGNGVEAYNMYRRTGYPDNVQPGLEPEVGQFVRSFFLPADHVTRNQNATQKSITDRVFWDDGSADLY